MPGGVPYTLLQYPDGGIDGCGMILSANYTYISVLLASGWAKKDVNMQGQKRGEQFASEMRGEAGTVIQGQNTLTSVGFEYGVTTMTSSTPVQVVSTANEGGANTLVYNQNFTRGYQGNAFNNENPYLNSTEGLLNSTFMADMRSHMLSVARDSDKAMYQAIFGNNYINVSAKTDAAMTQSTVTYAAHVTHAPLTWTVDIPASTNTQLTGFHISTFLDSAVHAPDAKGYTLYKSHQEIFLGLPDYAFNAVMVPLQSVFTSPLRRGISESDGSTNPNHALFNTSNGTTLMKVPLDWFYTVADDIKNSLICLMTTQDAIQWYAPKQNANMIQMLANFSNAMPGFSHIPNMNSMQLSQFLTNSLAAGPNPSLDFEQIMDITRRFPDPVPEILRQSIANRYPQYSNHEGYYDPLCYGINSYKMQPDSGITSWATAINVTRFAGALRKMPQYIQPIHIDPALLVETPPVYSNPYTATFAALNTMSNEAFVQFASANRDLVERDLKPEYVHKSYSRENTTEELINQKLNSTDWKAKTYMIVPQPSFYDTAIQGYERMGSKLTREQKVQVDAKNLKKMSDTMNKIGV